MSLTSLPYRHLAEDLRHTASSERSLSLLTGVTLAAGFALAVGWAVAATVSHLVSDALRDPTLFAAVAGWAAFVVLTGIAVWFADRSRKMSVAAFDVEQTLSFDDAGLRLVGPWGESFTRWEGIARAERRGDDVVLVGRAGVLFVLPARAVPDAAWRDDVLALAARHIAAPEA
jgi:hypothetical protein